MCSSCLPWCSAASQTTRLPPLGQGLLLNSRETRPQAASHPQPRKGGTGWTLTLKEPVDLGLGAARIESEELPESWVLLLLFLELINPLSFRLVYVLGGEALPT